MDARDPIEKEGWEAFKGALSRSENPYKAGTEERMLWDAGWVHAYECSH